MTATTAPDQPNLTERDGVGLRVSAALWRRPWARATILLTPPLAWFILVYVAALVVLLITAFWQINPFTTNIERVWNLGNFTQILGSSAYRAVIVRTVGMAAAVTVVDAIVAFPFAYYMARIASRRARTALFVAILLPLWASYLAKVYSWLLIFTHGGLLDWSLGHVGLGQVHLIYTNWAVFTVFCLHLAALHDHSGLRGAGTDPQLAAGSIAGSRRTYLDDDKADHHPARAARNRGRLHLHVLADARRLHHAAPGGRHQRELHGQHHLHQHRHR